MSEATRRVLIVDDEPTIVTALDFLFGRSGYRAQVVSAGEPAMRAIDAGRPDVVLMDVMTLGRSGDEACQADCERLALTGFRTVMRWSARSKDAEVSKGLSLGVGLHITEPFSTPQLAATVDGLRRRPAPPRQ